VPEELEPEDDAQTEPPTPMTAIEEPADQQDPAEPEKELQDAPAPSVTTQESEPEVVETPAAEPEHQPVSETADSLPKADDHDQSGGADAAQAPVEAGVGNDEKGEEAETAAAAAEKVETVETGEEEAAEVKKDDA